MEINQAYDQWAEQYDSNENKTRDKEALAIRECLGNRRFSCCLELGAGTGKNTVWLAGQAEELTAVDFSREMLNLAKKKISNPRVQFAEADLLQDWHFARGLYDLISFSLVLEHIENLDAIFAKAAPFLAPGGLIYLGELHPFRQYRGSKARFDNSEGRHILTCYVHHVSDFMQAAKAIGCICVDIREYGDQEENGEPPRILAMLFQKQKTQA